ncbi:hypothetical protein [Luteolibacter soli]|uniref:Uncharacterized protein n=1 Tax=Luteolibacter soli TaxID=3135280 RepID=A0ABU9B3H5_9BACT
MARYLMDHYELIGLTRKEVIAKLGDSGEESRMLYDLGPERGSMFKVDNDWLEISLPAGKVASGFIRISSVSKGGSREIANFV